LNASHEYAQNFSGIIASPYGTASYFKNANQITFIDVCTLDLIV
jgi:hypothetical protein